MSCPCLVGATRLFAILEAGAQPGARGAAAGASRRREALPMPIVRVEMWPGRTKEQKAELARAITNAVVRIAGTTPEATIVVFEDIAKENWAQGGVLATEA